MHLWEVGVVGSAKWALRGPIWVHSLVHAPETEDVAAHVHAWFVQKLKADWALPVIDLGTTSFGHDVHQYNE